MMNPTLETAVEVPKRVRGKVMNVHDVAKYILKKQGGASAMKLQKLLYYSQAWSLVWDERPLFAEPIQAWANGPVVPSVFEAHKGQFFIKDWDKGDVNSLDRKARETVDSVLKYYGDKTAQWLSDLTHSEAPWAGAREGLSPSERGNRVITHEAMAEYYSNIQPDND